ncbi:hypothetical protein D3C72_1997890 [compost metagenome]
MIKAHSTGSLNNGFKDQTRQFVLMCSDKRCQGSNVAGIPFFIKFNLRGGCEVTKGEGIAENTVHTGHRIAYRHGIPGVTVVSRTNGNKVGLVDLLLCHPILYSHFECRFHCNGT